jgi:hypothetical protein
MRRTLPLAEGHGSDTHTAHHTPHKHQHWHRSSHIPNASPTRVACTYTKHSILSTQQHALHFRHGSWIEDLSPANGTEGPGVKSPHDVLLIPSLIRFSERSLVGWVGALASNCNSPGLAPKRKSQHPAGRFGQRELPGSLCAEVMHCGGVQCPVPVHESTWWGGPEG